MIGNDVLEQFDKRRRLSRRIIDSFAGVLNVCLMLAFATFVFLLLISEPRNLEKHPSQIAASPPPPADEIAASAPPPAEELEKSAPSAEIQSSDAPASTVAEDSTSTQAPTIDRTAHSEPTGPSGTTSASEQTKEGGSAGTKKPNQTLVENVPMPVARPNPTGGTAKQEAESKTEQASAQSGTKADRPVTSEVDERRTLALDLERSYISSGITNISTRVSGLNGTVLNIEYPNLNDALVQKIMAVNSFAALLQKAGFTKIVFKGSQNKTWTIPLEKPSGPDTASQGAESKKPSQ